MIRWFGFSVAMAFGMLLGSSAVAQTQRYALFNDVIGAENPSGSFSLLHTPDGKAEIKKTLKETLVAEGDAVEFVFEAKNFANLIYVQATFGADKKISHWLT